MKNKSLIHDFQSSSTRKHQTHQVGAISSHSFTPQKNNLFLNFCFPQRCERQRKTTKKTSVKQEICDA